MTFYLSKDSTFTVNKSGSTHNNLTLY